MNDNVFSLGFDDDTNEGFFVGLEVGMVAGFIRAQENPAPSQMMVHTDNIKMISDLCYCKGWRADIISSDDDWAEIHILKGLPFG